jgi:AraC family transcriptional activator of pobA
VITAAQRPLESLAGLIFPPLLETLRRPAVLPLEAGDRHVQQLLPLCRGIEREWRTSGAGQIAACQSLLLTLMIQLYRIKETLGLGPAQPQPPINSRRYRQVENFRALVDLHFREHLPVQWYAERMNLSASQLSRLCRDSLGMGALDVMAARLMHEAQRDLVYTVDSVKAIATNLGFRNDAYFSRFFRKRAGTTPTAFREQALQAMRESP